MEERLKYFCISAFERFFYLKAPVGFIQRKLSGTHCTVKGKKISKVYAYKERNDIYKIKP